MKPRMVRGTWIDLDVFEKHIRELGEKYKAEGNPVGQRMIDKAPEIAGWYVQHQCPMRSSALAKILEAV